jgi:hypothetical protein
VAVVASVVVAPVVDVVTALAPVPAVVGELARAWTPALDQVRVPER